MALRSRTPAFVAVALAIGGALPACTFLAEFIDDPDPCSGGRCLDGAVDGAADARDAAAGDARADVKDAAFDGTGACKGKSNGFYCGNNGLSVPVPKEYLVECRDGGAILTYCTNDCLAFPKGTPDRCDPCAGKANGSYCGASFWPNTENATYRFTCGGGTAIIQENCALGCTLSMGASVCK